MVPSRRVLGRAITVCTIKAGVIKACAINAGPIAGRSGDDGKGVLEVARRSGGGGKIWRGQQDPKEVVERLHRVKRVKGGGEEVEKRWWRSDSGRWQICASCLCLRI